MLVLHTTIQSSASYVVEINYHRIYAQKALFLTTYLRMLFSILYADNNKSSASVLCHSYGLQILTTTEDMSTIFFLLHAIFLFVYTTIKKELSCVLWSQFKMVVDSTVSFLLQKICPKALFSFLPTTTRGFRIATIVLRQQPS